MPLIVNPEALGEPGTAAQAEGDARVLCRCPPQTPAEGRRWHRQADRHYLGLRQGLPFPGWLFAGIARGREKGSEKGPWDAPHIPETVTPASARA